MFVPGFKLAMKSTTFRAILFLLGSVHLNAQNDLVPRLDALPAEAAAKDVFSGTQDELKKEGRFAIAGGAPGISAVYSRNFSQNRSVIVLSNFDEGSAEMLFQRIGAILNGQTAEPLQPSTSKFIYSLLKEKGAAYFTDNIERELNVHGHAIDDDMVLLFAGQAVLSEGKADEAIALYRFYTQKFPRIVVAWNDLGDAYLMKNDKENAKKCFQKALDLRPGNVRAKESLDKIK